MLAWSTALFDDDRQDGESVYVASAILYSENTAPGARRATPLDRVATLAKAGGVDERVATTLGVSTAEVARKIIITPNAQLGTVSLAASGDEPNELSLLVDTYADELTSYLDELESRAHRQKIDELQRSVDELARRYSDLEKKVFENPTDELLAAEKEATLDSFTEARQQLEKLRSEPPPKFGLQQLEPAQSVPVSPEFVDDLRAGNADVRDVARLRSTQTRDSGGTNPLLRSLLGAGLGLGVGVAGALVFDRIDPRVRSKEDAEEAYDLPVLAEIPPMPRAWRRRPGVYAAVAPRSHLAEAFRTLRSSLLYAAASTAAPQGPQGTEAVKPPQVLMVTSANPAEGKTTTAANLAATFGEAGYKVLVVNCDFRRPMVHRLFGAPDPPTVEVFRTSVEGVHVLGRVTDEEGRAANPAKVVAEQRRVVTRARDHFDLVIVDTAPMLTTNDASDLMPVTDMVLVVGRAGKTNRMAARRLSELLRRREAPVVGVALVAAREPLGPHYYYYRYGRYLRLGRKADGYYTDSYYDDSLSAKAGNGSGSRQDERPGAATGSTEG